MYLYRRPEVNPERTVTRSQTDSYKHYKREIKPNKEENFFIVITTDIWNTLPNDLINIRQVTKFKNRLVQWIIREN